MDVDFNKMWVLPIFLKPGKNDFMIRTPKDDVIDFQMKKGIFIDLMDYQTE